MRLICMSHTNIIILPAPKYVPGELILLYNAYARLYDDAPLALCTSYSYKANNFVTDIIYEILRPPN